MTHPAQLDIGELRLGNWTERSSSIPTIDQPQAHPAHPDVQSKRTAPWLATKPALS
jgi:hypothetical protein